MNVLAVCLGNICRSPLAEGLLQLKADEAGLDWHVDSAGTSAWHEGERADSRSREVAKKNGLDIDHQRSRPFVIEDFDQFDLILVMDSSNYQNVLKLARNETDKQKVKLILNYLYPNENRAVPDPYYEGGFDAVYRMIEQAAEQVVAEYQKT